eukprot:1151105-Pelagomonas_calceolata.AAC.5
MHSVLKRVRKCSGCAQVGRERKAGHQHSDYIEGVKSLQPVQCTRPRLLYSRNHLQLIDQPDERAKIVLQPAGGIANSVACSFHNSFEYD